MRICIINEFFYPDNVGGTGTVLSELVETLHQRYGETLHIEVITSRNLYRGGGEDLLPPHSDWNGVSIHRVDTPCSTVKSIKKRLMANIAFAFAVTRKLLQLPRFDLVVASTAPPTCVMAAWFLKMLKGVPYHYVVYDLEPDRSIALKVLPEKGILIQAVRLLQKQWLKNASEIIVLGRCMLQHIATTYRIPQDQFRVVPVGANPDEITPATSGEAYRKELGLEGFVLLYSGNFGRYHDFDALLDAARNLRNTRKDIQFLLVGNGPKREQIEKRIALENLSNVKLMGFVPRERYPELLASCDAGLVTLEAGMEGLCVPSKFYSILSSGKAVVALVPRKTEVAMVIEESCAGVVVEPEDWQALAKELVALADNPPCTQKMGMNARKALTTQFTNHHIAERFYSGFCATIGHEANHISSLDETSEVETPALASPLFGNKTNA